MMKRLAILPMKSRVLAAIITLPLFSTPSNLRTPLPPVPISQTSERQCNSKACYYYVGETSSVKTSGASVWLSQPSPHVGPNGSHSLAELSILNERNDSIEVGWTVDPSRGDQKSHLFVFYWKNNVPTCYDFCGFVSTSSKIKPGQVVPKGPAKFSIFFRKDRWLVGYNGKSIGYFPANLWEDFKSGSQVMAFGEVANIGTSPPQTQMGNGRFGTQSSSAQIYDFKIETKQDVTRLYFNIGGGYDKAIYNGRLAGFTGRFYYGGPGDEG